MCRPKGADRGNRSVPLPSLAAFWSRRELGYHPLRAAARRLSASTRPTPARQGGRAPAAQCGPRSHTAFCLPTLLSAWPGPPLGRGAQASVWPAQGSPGSGCGRPLWGLGDKRTAAPRASWASPSHPRRPGPRLAGQDSGSHRPCRLHAQAAPRRHFTVFIL